MYVSSLPLLEVPSERTRFGAGFDQAPAKSSSENGRSLPTMTVDDIIVPASYGFSSVPAFAHAQPLTAVVDGTWFRSGVIQELIGAAGTLSPANESRREGTALLALESNAHNGAQVTCIFDGRIIGRLSPHDAERLLSPLRELVQHSRHLEVHASLRFHDQGEGRAEVYLQLPQTHNILPHNGYPNQPWMLLPGGNPATVRPKDIVALEQLDVPFTDPLPVAVTARLVVQIRARSAVESLAICLNDSAVAVIPAQQASTALPLVKMLEERGISPVLRTNVYRAGNNFEIDVELPAQEALNPRLVDSILELPVVRRG